MFSWPPPKSSDISPRDSKPLVGSELTMAKDSGAMRSLASPINEKPPGSTESVENSRESSDDEQQRSSCCQCCACCGKMPRCGRSTVRLIYLVLFMIGYLLLGAVVFSALESPSEEDLKSHVHRKRREFMGNHTCVPDAELEAFIVEVVKANNRGVSAARNVTSEPNWSFGQSMFFAGTILTTIGYGHVTPLSEGGKIFCIVYAAIGIPLTLIMFTALVERLMILTSSMLEGLVARMGHLYKLLHIRLIHLAMILGFVVVFIFLIPSAIFTYIEDEWNYLDSFYYCFISMTTIGLGDYIPGDNPQQIQRPLYKICTTFYLFIGLVLMMLLLANIYDIPELNIGYHFYMRSDQEDGERTRLNSSDAGPKYTEQVNKAYVDESGSGGRRGADERTQLTK